MDWNYTAYQDIDISTINIYIQSLVLTRKNKNGKLIHQLFLCRTAKAKEIKAVKYKFLMSTTKNAVLLLKNNNNKNRNNNQIA